ncbi:hypothetical protein [Streptomyces sp. HPF1205]|uniref:hypothetical protein n=1 Tax=Streptomyces sp. HPF1205 TaxID=2873262 RepID=UPI001CEC6813|nr:hypothetical protein [Streptomyces sp. HPF1205]
MADTFGPTKPAGPDPIDERLRQLVHDTEPLVTLDGPAAVRRRGERRRARRRTGAVCLTAALALGLGSWQLLPRLGGDGPATLPAGTVSAPPPAATLAERLRRELLPPTDLPLYPANRWRAVPRPEAAAKFPEPCPVDAAGRRAVARADQVYTTPERLVAHYHLYAMASAPDAADVRDQLDMVLTHKCGWGKEVGSTPLAGDPGRLDGSAYYGPSGTVWLEREGTFIAFLEVTSSLPGGGKAAYSEAGTPGKMPRACIESSLDRLAVGSSLDRLASGVPSSGPGATGGGSPTAPTASTAQGSPSWAAGSGTGPGADTGAATGTSQDLPAGTALPGASGAHTC